MTLIVALYRKSLTFASASYEILHVRGLSLRIKVFQPILEYLFFEIEPWEYLQRLPKTFFRLKIS